jgi:3-isopropylmalate dehydrogenase
MLSDVAAMLTGSLGMLPSASLGAPGAGGASSTAGRSAPDANAGKRRAMYEPVHGSAPDIAGKGLANPIAMIASFGMALRYSLSRPAEADLLEKAIASVLETGIRTADIMQTGATKVGTAGMGDAILKALDKISA